MRKSITGEFRTTLGVGFALLIIVVSIISACGGSSKVDAPVVDVGPHVTPTQPTIATIASKVADIVSTPYLAGNAVQYYCDCQTGAGQGCTAGSDTAGAGTEASPFQTITAAMTWLNGGANRTVALCRGGSFTLPPATGQYGLVLSANASCPGGSICNELREYPIGGTGVKPLISNLTGNHSLFSTINGGGGFRFMNLKLQGYWDTNRTKPGNYGFFLYSNSGLGRPPVRDIAIQNVDFDGFDLGVDNAVNANNNITIIGSHFTNISTWGYLGGSSNLTIAYNSFVNCGSDNIYDHAIYFASHEPVSNVSIVGNFISGFSTASANSKCIGSPLTGHAAVTNLTVSGNVIIEEATADPQCYGIGFTNTTDAQGAIYFRNAIFSDNVVVNGGAAGIAVTSCPYCVIENNLVISQSNSGGSGITTPSGTARTQDDVENNATVVNNTIYYGTTSSQGLRGGVSVGVEGTGHIVANNAVMYAGTLHNLNRTNCFNYSLPLAAYAFINNNSCYSNDQGTNWVYGSTGYSISAWQTFSASAGAAGTGFDTATASSYADPGWTFAAPLGIPALDETKTGAQLFAAYFTPAAASPLSAAGNAANAPAADIANTARPATPSIGAYEN